MLKQDISGFLDFLREIPSPRHTAQAVCKRLLAAGFSPLPQDKPWEASLGGKYFARRGDALIAFRLPKAFPTCALIGAAHGDFPALALRPTPMLSRPGGAVGLSVERYGGCVLPSFMDRPLSVAGRVYWEEEGEMKEALVDLHRPLCVIPTTAPHMNREPANGTAYSMTSDMIPLYGLGECDLLLRVAEAVSARKEDILSHELFLSPCVPPTLLGDHEEFLCGAHLDDSLCVYGLLEGFLRADATKTLPMLAIFDHEEVGSSTAEGANSDFLPHTLLQIAALYGEGVAAVDRMLAGGLLVSADNAHAIHPNHPEYADPNHAPILNGGIVVKYAASKKYATSGKAAATFTRACKRAGVPLQTYANRADLPGGSTLGAIITTRVAVPTVDIGLAQLAMHSSLETAGAEDLSHLIRAMQEIYSGN